METRQEEFDEFNAKKKSTFTEKCPNCGANLVFNPTTQQLYCKYCETSVDFNKSSEVKELDITDVLFSGIDDRKWEETSSYRCENCGAVVLLDNSDRATKCPYCGASHIVKTEQMSGIQPNAVYPFTLTEEEAVERVSNHVKKRLFVSNKFKKSLNAENITGVYQPAYTFDSDTFSTYDGVLGKRRTRTVGSGKNRRTETYIEWKHVSGNYSEFFNDIFISTSKTLPPKWMNKIMPFNYDTIKVFEQRYLVGFMATQHDQDIKTSWSQAKSIIDSVLRKNITDKYNCDVVKYLNVSTKHSSVTYKYVLLPVYIFNYNFKGKSYNVYVNGNTGKVAGSKPLSAIKIIIAVILGLALVVGAAYLYYKSIY